MTRAAASRSGGLLALALTIGVALGQGCGVPRGMAVGATRPIVEGALLAAYQNGDVELVEAAIPSNLLLVEGLLANRPKDKHLLMLACQLYFNYGVGFIEDRNPDRARGLYEKAMALGFRAYPDLEPSRYTGSTGEASYREKIASLEKDDVADLIWLAGSWGSWIKLNMGSSEAISEAPRLQQLAERLVELDGSYLYGMPHLLLATIRALTPTALGGEPDSARAEFEAGFAVSDRKFLLMHVFFAKYYCRQIFDVDLFDSILGELRAADPAALPDVLLLNKVAQAQGRRLAELRDELF